MNLKNASGGDLVSCVLYTKAVVRSSLLARLSCFNMRICASCGACILVIAVIGLRTSIHQLAAAARPDLGLVYGRCITVKATVSARTDKIPLSIHD